jgi:hypothetical protein
MFKTIGPLGKPAPSTVSRRGKGFGITLFLFCIEERDIIEILFLDLALAL